VNALISRHAGRVEDCQSLVRRVEIRRLAQAIRQADENLTANNRQLTEIVNRITPQLLQRRRTGPVSAAQVIVSYSHPGRCRNDGAFASPAGSCPIPTSSGRTRRWRLNRGGDRALNRALHTIAVSRMTSCPRTRDYAERRRAEGKSNAEIRRCLKRYISHEIFRLLNTQMA
jgi:transposase